MKRDIPIANQRSQVIGVAIERNGALLNVSESTHTQHNQCHQNSGPHDAARYQQQNKKIHVIDCAYLIN